MKFKTPALEAQFRNAHPEARKRAMDLDAWLESLRWPEVFITAVSRTRADMVRIYGEAGRKRNSWHLWDCAWDMRNSSYRLEQRAAILERLREGTTPATHEVLEHDVGSGSHFHFAVKDVKWRKERAP